MEEGRGWEKRRGRRKESGERGRDIEMRDGRWRGEERRGGKEDEDARGEKGEGKGWRKGGLGEEEGEEKGKWWEGNGH